MADVALRALDGRGPDGRDGGVAPVALRPPGLVRGLRVAVLVDDGLAPPDEDTRRVVALAAEALRTRRRSSRRRRRRAAGTRSRSRSGSSYGAEAIAVRPAAPLGRYREAMLGFGEGFDLILSPVFPDAGAARTARSTNLTVRYTHVAHR